jgi:hypothetical protein
MQRRTSAIDLVTVGTLKSVARAIALAIFISGTDVLAEENAQRGSAESLTVWLVHPDRQAAAILKLFEGCRAPHPAAALTAWKRATRDTNQLGKPTEAVIAFFNPDMVREWKALHEAELQLGFDHESGSARWTLVAPQDDGTIAALVTALRLTDGADDPPLAKGSIRVERLGGSRPAFASRGGPGTGLVLASSRDALERVIDCRGQIATNPRGAGAGLNGTNGGPLAREVESGLVFQFDPEPPESLERGTTTVRRIAEIARGLGIVSAQGLMGIEQNRLAIDVNAKLNPDHPVVCAGKASTSIDPGWLAWVPASQAVAVVSLALEQGGAYWDGLFALADRVDRADPARANLAPLRTRLTLLATAAGTRLEVDLWPHLRGVTLSALCSFKEPGLLGGAILALHVDDEPSARQIASDVVPRLVNLQRGLKERGHPPARGAAGSKAAHDAGSTRLLGRVSGRPLEVITRGRTVLIGWGEGSLAAAINAADHSEDTVLKLVSSLWPRPEPVRLSRAGVFWPGRMTIPLHGLDGPTPLVQSLAQGPPIVWSGWGTHDQAHDRICWPELQKLVKHFVDSVPLDPVAVP